METNERVEYEKIWPLHLEILERDAFLDRLLPHAREMCESDDVETRRLGLKAREALTRLAATGSKEKVFYETVIRIAEDTRTAGHGYSILQVSRTRFQIVKTYSHERTQAADAEQGWLAVMRSYPVTERVSRLDAETLYECLALRREVPALLQKFVLKGR